MVPARRLLFRYRVVVLALAVSAAIHATLIVGAPNRPGSLDESEGPVYTASLDAEPSNSSDGANVTPTPPPRPTARPRPRRPKPESPKPEQVVAQAASRVETPVQAQPAAPEPEPELPPEPDLPPAPEKIALAPAIAPPSTPEPEPFPENALPGHLKVSYELTSAFADGRATYEWDRDGDDYVITGEAEAVGFFTLFLEGRVQQESRGKVTRTGLRPERFTESLPKSKTEGLQFDWAGRKIVFDRNGEKTEAELKDDAVDWLSMIFQLAHRPPKGDFVLRVFTQRRLYEFRLKVLGEEEIEIPIGKLRALHLRHVDEEKNEYVDVWLGVEQHYMPVKLRYPVARNRIMVEQTATSISER
jgi:hypothetical protein